MPFLGEECMPSHNATNTAANSAVDSSAQVDQADQLETFIEDLEGYMDSVRARSPKYKVVGAYGQLQVEPSEWHRIYKERKLGSLS